ncbi:MAG: sugar phosphate permease [Candidatus Aminicenantes bacterium RBG_16_63_14]|nr:MAG: sugar phosphate permease [Candidatus Aminicenantes bacterium RBG_16_63_14]OGD27757.1 MAG: sugar phosphate permease [Candidatus Aminicenantes bacterium RBG_19FT_COMBO_65_30]
MENETIKVYRYRWLVLAAFVAEALMTQVLWITFAPITGAAAAFYGKSDLMIGLLSMVFMIVYILAVLPAAWAIDTWGFKAAVGLGAVLTAVFGLLRGIFASNYTVVLLAQVGIAAGQPLVIGAITKIAARWFPVRERATASGLGTLALYLGPLIAMLLTPYLFLRIGMSWMLHLYGFASVLSAALFLLVAREHPPTPAGRDERVLMFDGLRSMLRQRDFLFLLVMFFVGLGLFNSVSTWVEDIVRPRGFSISQAGALGGLMLVGGIVGAVVIPIISDKSRRRKPFIVLALAGLIPGLIGMTFAASYGLLLLSGFAFGFFLLSAGPIGFQYAAEITHPAPEGTSNSLLILMGQVSGIAFIMAMDALKDPATGAMTTSLLILAGLAAASAVLAAFVRESPVHGERSTVMEKRGS